MPYAIEIRFVSTSKWYNPLTWKSGYTEYRRVWDMDSRLLPSEVRTYGKDVLSGVPHRDLVISQWMKTLEEIQDASHA